MRKILTLCIIHQNDRVLLGLKKRGFGQGRWNGFGGKVHPGESVAQAAQRELREEVGIVADDLILIGNLHFTIAATEDDLEVHLFKIREFSGEPTESEEMKPQWFKIDKIPFDKMWPDDIYWFPLFLQDKKFTAEFNFQDNKTLLNYKIHENH